MTVPKYRAVITGDKGKSILIYSKDHDVTFYKDYVQFWQGLVNYKIDYKHLMQYTGLKDKNGVEVFDGDILKGNDGEVFFNKVYFDEVQAKWMRDDDIELWENIETMEVVGNTYKNPELVEVIE